MCFSRCVDDGSCILNIYVCDGIVDCSDHTDEDTALCSTSAIRKMNATLTDYDHEMGCLSFHIYNRYHLCVEIYLEKFNYNNITKFNEYSDAVITANVSTKSVCHSLRSEMFYNHKRCMFERVGSGDPAHCSNTEHLKFCEFHECPDGYKCPRSYCIPIHMLCDGVKDCPEDEDELICKAMIVEDLVRCRHDNIYLHPRHVCDGVVHCIHSHDDETVCEMYDCPRNCLCRGYFIMCLEPEDKVIRLPNHLKALYIRNTQYNIFMENATYANINILDLANTTIFRDGIPELFFYNMTTLQILNLQNTSITSLANKSFMHLDNLRKLSISYNAIKVIHKESFVGLSNILILNLTDLCISQLEQLAFDGLTSLILLNISHNFIKSFEKQTFAGLDSLTTLDMLSNHVTAIDINALHLNRVMFVAFNYTTPANRKSSMEIFVDNKAMCCFITSTVKCRMLQKSPKQANCNMLITKRIYAAFYFLCSVVLSFFGGFVFYIQLRQEQYNGQLPLMLSLATKDILTALMALILLTLYFIFDQNYSLHRSIVSSSVICKLHGFLTVYTQFVVKHVISIMCLIHYRIIVYPMTRRPYRIRKIVQFMCVLNFIDLNISILWTYFTDTESSFLCSPFSLHATVSSMYISLTVVSLYLLYSCILLIVVLAGYLYTYNKVKSTELHLRTMSRSNLKKKTSETLKVHFIMTVIIHGMHLCKQFIMLLSPILFADFNDEFSILLFYVFALADATVYTFLYNRVHIQNIAQKIKNVLKL